MPSYGLMKRTNLRTNPEDEAHFRQHRDSVRSKLEGGSTPEQTASALVAQGVPAETARRIVWAVQQELSLKAIHSEESRMSLWWAFGLGVPFLAAILAYGGFLWARDGATLLSVLSTVAPSLFLVSGMVAATWKRME
jgi:hypothetical protein